MADETPSSGDRGSDALPGAQAPTRTATVGEVAAAPPGGPLRRLNSRDLFAGSVQIEIEHQSQVYRLRRTALGKLILTK